MSGTLQIRELASAADYAACVRLQKETWGEQFTECVPATMLRIAQKLGGIAAGAFENDELLGFVFGLTGLMDGAVVHWSDMLAVRATQRDRGIGERLKRYQRDTLLARGIKRVFWSFDPLDAKNAHINFNRLGVYAREYIIDMYGHTDSPLHEGIGTDRLIVTWALDREDRVDRTDRPVHIEVPANIHELNRRDPQRAREWRETTRAQFLRYLPEYVVTGFEREGESGFYALTSASNFAT
ncbi:MAG: GNAT family N-acetyltransferase [Gemmatimonadota bacterium]